MERFWEFGACRNFGVFLAAQGSHLFPFCQLSVVFTSIFRVFNFVLDTSARQNASELAFALAYSYL
jgi:hypothetical protein